eukprot:s541_g20.t1
MVVAVVVDSFAESRQKDLLHLAEEMEHENEKDKKHLEEMFDRLDSHDKGDVTLEQLVEGANTDEGFQSRLRVMDIDQDDLEQLFHMMPGMQFARWTGEGLALQEKYKRQARRSESLQEMVSEDLRKSMTRCSTMKLHAREVQEIACMTLEELMTSKCTRRSSRKAHAFWGGSPILNHKRSFEMSLFHLRWVKCLGLLQDAHWAHLSPQNFLAFLETGWLPSCPQAVKRAPLSQNQALAGTLCCDARGVAMGSPDTPSASERQWLWMPVVCTICLIIAVFAGCLRIGRIWCFNQSNAGTSRWYGIKWVLRISYGVGLAAGALGLADSLRRFYVHRDQAAQASEVFLFFPILTYAFLVGSCGLILLGRLCLLRNRQAAEQAYHACKQNAGISFLAGLTAGITQEVLCGFDDKEFSMPDAWRESCQLLGGSCGLICISLIVAQADGVEKRRPWNDDEAVAKAYQAPEVTRQESASGSILGDSFLPRRDQFSSRLPWTAPDPPEANWAPPVEATRQESCSLTDPLLRSPDCFRADSEIGSAWETEPERPQGDATMDGGRIEREQHAKRDAGTHESREVFHTPGGQGHRRGFGSPFWRSPEPHESQWAMPAMQQVVTAGVPLFGTLPTGNSVALDVLVPQCICGRCVRAQNHTDSAADPFHQCSNIFGRVHQWIIKLHVAKQAQRAHLTISMFLGKLKTFL